MRPDKLMAGAPIGGYELQYVLGEGGMGVVWAAHDPLLDRTIAIKVLKSRDVHDAMRTRLLREAQAMAQIKHPNVLTVHRVGTEGDRDYIAMELVDGGPLDHWLAFGPPEHEVMEALLAAGRGLAAAHAAGLVHRDFKPNNILRNKDGHVLVTDFGLARGLGDDWSSPVTATGSLDPDRARDNVLASPLTKTGALLGTPAYMAPEQFAGAEPDPRTDQFAYCVTAWQALTGARPFHGRTIDELRQAATAGVGGVVAQLGKPMRAVLTRGLDPDPAKRWPDMQTLLREIERAGRPPKRKLPWIAGGAAIAVAGIVAMGFAMRGAAAPACAPIDEAWAGAWTARGLPDEHAWIGDVLDDHRQRWFQTYEHTCKAAIGTAPVGRLDCLHAVRSRIAVVGELVMKHPETRVALDPWLYLAPPEACSGRPAELAAFPDDRERVLAVLARAIALPNSDGLAAEVKATGWAPLEPMVLVTAGLRRVREGAIAEGRALLDKVAAADTDPRLVARARLGLLAASMKELAHPDAAGKPDVLHEELAKALTYARSAVKPVEDPTLIGILAFLEAELVTDQTERAAKKTTYADALELATRARTSFEAARDPRRAASAAALYADIQLRRGDPSALSDAEFVARSAAELLDRVKRPPLVPLDRLRAAIAFARNDLPAAHRWLDRAAPRPAGAAKGELVSGVVLGPDGKPVMNATVIAWTGELRGDALRAVTDRTTLRGDLVETSAEGKFTLRVAPGSAVVAESPGGGLRSLPVRADAKELTLRLAPTTDLAGKLDTDGPGPHVYARYAVGQAAWLIETPLLAGNGFQFTNLPHAAWEIGALGPSGTGTRRARGGSVTVRDGPKLVFNGIAWVTGTPIDVVVRGAVSPEATVWVGDAKSIATLTTRGDIEAHASSSLEIAWSPLLPIGSRYTDAGRSFYLAGARHAVLVGDFKDAAGWAAATAEPTAKLTCKRIERDARAIALDL